MNEMINGKMDNKNIGLLINLGELRQTLDVHCLISTNVTAIKRMGVGKSFFYFLRRSCLHLIALYICKVFEKEKLDKQGVVKHELDSIESILKCIDIDKEKAAVLDSARIREFVQKYGSDSDKDGLAAISAVVKKFRKQYHEALSRFKTFRDKSVAHSESGFSPEAFLPSYDVMERLFNFGLDFYMLVARAISVGPADLNRDRKVRTSLKRILEKLGCEDIKTEME